MKRALISVSNKEGIVEFARELAKLDYEIISTGGTYKTLKDAGIPVFMVADITGFPEILDGRVKTLHPAIHGGILARRVPEHMVQLKYHGITPIDIVVVNLYPFRETVSRPDVTMEEAIENIDIGGPSMVRSAAKNYQDVVVLVNPENYETVLDELKKTGTVSDDLRLRLALEAFTHTAAYDTMISSYLAGVSGSRLDTSFLLAGEKVYDLRYGENPHQAAGFYRSLTSRGGLPDAKQLNGKELSYNNIIDSEAAWDLVQEFKQTACVIIKHTNPCGVAVAAKLEEAYVKAYDADPQSAYGGIIAFNRVVDKATAQKVAETFMEVIIAPGFDKSALEILQAKKNLRLLQLDAESSQDLQVRSVKGGFVVQERDASQVDFKNLQVVTETKLDASLLADLEMAWKVVKNVKSNAIVVVKDGVTLGVGAGQMNRVGAANIALEQGGEKCQGAVMASDAFLPFGDTVESAAGYGIKAIIQPGGSVRDEQSIEACNKHGIAMVFTNERHFKH